jgi:phage/plasmid-associated DNA primase
MLLDIYKTLPENRADLVFPKMVKDATSDYLNDQNPLKMWLEAEFDKTVNPEDKHFFWSATDLRDMFLSWSRTDPNQMSAVKFAEALTVMNGVSKKTMTNNFMGYEMNHMTGEVEQKLRKAGVYYTGLRKKTTAEGGME